MDKDLLDLQIDIRTNSIIKVIGVGGGGGNAVNHMYKEGIHDVSFALCNTDNQALMNSPVPVKLQLGEKTTGGLGAGNKPEVARKAAEESAIQIDELLNDGTRMVFITAGMGGGTGTGAAPVVAQIAKDMGILTVGIVTIPFVFEGTRKILQALKGVEEIANNVDALLVINNERLRDIYQDLTVSNAFAKADDTLAIAAKSIAEIITIHGHVNLDFADVETTLKDGGVAIMSRGNGEGENRVEDAIQNAINSPLLNNNDIFNAKKILINISYSEDKPLMMEEMNALHNFMAKFGHDIEVIWGSAVEEKLGETVKVTLLATGFTIDDVTGIGGGGDIERKKREKAALKKAEEKEDQKLIEKYYGSSVIKALSSSGINTDPYILSVEELDNDTVLEAIEKNPVFKRQRDFEPKNFKADNRQGATSTLF